MTYAWKVLVGLAALTGVCASLASAAGSEPRLALTERQNELARTTSLRRGDLPQDYHGGFVPGKPAGYVCRGFSPPMSDLTATGFARAAFANNRSVTVWSEVTIFGTASQVDLDMRRTIKPPLARCLGELVAAANGGELLSAKRVAFRSRLDHAAAYQIAVRRAGVVRQVRFFLLGHGRIECRLVLRGDGRSVPTQLAHLAVSLIEARMED